MSKNFDTIWDGTSNHNRQTDEQVFFLRATHDRIGHIKLMNRSLKNIEEVLWSSCIERLLTMTDRSCVSLGITSWTRFSILSCFHRCRWRRFFLLYLLFVALLRPVRFLLQNRENVASDSGNLVTRFEIRLAHCSVGVNVRKAGRRCLRWKGQNFRKGLFSSGELNTKNLEKTV